MGNTQQVHLPPALFPCPTQMEQSKIKHGMWGGEVVCPDQFMKTVYCGIKTGPILQDRIYILEILVLVFENRSGEGDGEMEDQATSYEIVIMTHESNNVVWARPQQ